jgi:hypothetical protein
MGKAIDSPCRKSEQTRAQRLVVMMMPMMRVSVTIRTGGDAPCSASGFTWVPTTRLAQHHSSPEVAR